MRTITFNDEDAIAPLQQLQAAYPNVAIYLSGSLTVDFPEEINLPILSLLNSKLYFAHK